MLAIKLGLMPKKDKFNNKNYSGYVLANKGQWSLKNIDNKMPSYRNNCLK
jgi:hypothetical protein